MATPHTHKHTWARDVGQDEHMGPSPSPSPSPAVPPKAAAGSGVCSTVRTRGLD